MRVCRTVIVMLALIGAGHFCRAQSDSANREAQVQRAAVESSPAPHKGTVPATPPSAQAEALKPTVEQEIEALKNRISQLENEVRQARARALSDSNDAATLKVAEKELIAGSAPAITQAAPQSSSQTTPSGPPTTQITATATIPGSGPR